MTIRKNCILALWESVDEGKHEPFVDAMIELIDERIAAALGKRGHTVADLVPTIDAMAREESASTELPVRLHVFTRPDGSFTFTNAPGLGVAEYVLASKLAAECISERELATARADALEEARHVVNRSEDDGVRSAWVVSLEELSRLRDEARAKARTHAAKGSAK